MATSTLVSALKSSITTTASTPAGRLDLKLSILSLIFDQTSSFLAEGESRST